MGQKRFAQFFEVCGRRFAGRYDAVPYPVAFIGGVVGAARNLDNPYPQFMSPHQVGLYHYLRRGLVAGVGCGSRGFKPKLIRSESSKGSVRKNICLKSRMKSVIASKTSLHWALATGVRVVSFWAVSSAALAAPLRAVSSI
jgi:hypothetical protein